MARQVMRREASDNEYLHRDFHGALSAAIEYLDRRYGEEAVRSYLREFTDKPPPIAAANGDAAGPAPLAERAADPDRPLSFSIPIQLRLDPLTATMLAVVTFVGLLFRSPTPFAPPSTS